MIKLLLLTIVIIVIAFIVNYAFECEKCVKSCIVFSDLNANECVNDCKCIDNRFNNWLNYFSHVDNLSYKELDDQKCKNNYDTTIPTLVKKHNIIKKLPNIVLIVSDDISESVDPYFEAMPFAKELFKLNGTHFSNGFTSTSFCCPARCQIFTGMYGHNNGVISSSGSYSSMNAFMMPLYLNESRQMSNGKCINNFYRSLHMYLKKYGNYSNGMFGKFLNGGEASKYSKRYDILNTRFHGISHVPPGWDKFDTTANNYMYIGNMYVMSNWSSEDNVLRHNWYGRSESDYLTDVIARKSIGFIRRERGKHLNPLFMYLASTAPHGPMTSAYRHRDKLKYWDNKFDQYVSSRPNYHSDQSMYTKSSWLRDTAIQRDELQYVTPLYYKTDKKINMHKLEWRKRMASLYALDDMIKATHDEFETIGELNNTIFIFVSDNGFNYGAHKLGQKMTAYEESIKVPIYFSGTPFKKGHIDNRLTLLQDITPTILNILGFNTPDHIDGIDLLSDISRKSILLEYGRRRKSEKYTGNLNDLAEFKMILDIAPKTLAFDVAPYIAIRTHKHLLINYYNADNTTNNEYELYDLDNDPYEIFNIVNDKQNTEIVIELKNRLTKLSTCYGHECNDI